MEFFDVVSDRRSIRKYLSDKIDLDILIEGIKCGILAPSAHNRQPWKFRILDGEQKDCIADLLEEKVKGVEGHSGIHTASVIREAPHLIVIFIDNNECCNRDLDLLSIGAFVQNILLYYEDHGLGVLWIGNTNLISDDIKKYLNVDYETVSCIAVGRKNQSPHARPRKDINDIIV